MKKNDDHEHEPHLHEHVHHHESDKSILTAFLLNFCFVIII